MPRDGSGYRGSSKLGQTERWNAELLDENKALKEKLGQIAAVKNPLGQRTLKECEAIIHEGVKAHIDAWFALKEIHDRSLYKPKYADFGEYCLARWGYRREGYRYLQAANVCQVVTPNLPPPPTSAHAQSLMPLLDQPEKLKEAWSLALELNDGHPTFLEVKDIVRGFLPPSEPTASGHTLESPTVEPSSPPSDSPSFSGGITDDSFYSSPPNAPALGPTSEASGESPAGERASSWPSTFWTIEEVMKHQGQINGAIREAAKHASEPAVRVWLVSMYQFLQKLMETENLV